MPDVTVFILAGGKSSRMGSDKALLDFGGVTLIERAVSLASEVPASVRVIGDPEKYAHFGETITDIHPGHGPLGGIHAALRATVTDLNIVLAVDMPFLAPAFVRYVVEQASGSAALVTVPFVNGRFQPLCAVYRPGFADRAEEALKKNRNKIDPLFTPDITRIITQDEIERLAFTVSMFDNLNTREELARARAEAEAK